LQKYYLNNGEYLYYSINYNYNNQKNILKHEYIIENKNVCVTSFEKSCNGCFLKDICIEHYHTKNICCPYNITNICSSEEFIKTVNIIHIEEKYVKDIMSEMSDMLVLNNCHIYNMDMDNNKSVNIFKHNENIDI